LQTQKRFEPTQLVHVISGDVTGKGARSAAISLKVLGLEQYFALN
jgi:serine phosphatase RsbU (regulator of sigma subunit)